MYFQKLWFCQILDRTRKFLGLSCSLHFSSLTAVLQEWDQGRGKEKGQRDQRERLKEWWWFRYKQNCEEGRTRLLGSTHSWRNQTFSKSTAVLTTWPLKHSGVNLLNVSIPLIYSVSRPLFLQLQHSSLSVDNCSTLCSFIAFLGWLFLSHWDKWPCIFNAIFTSLTKVSQAISKD